MIKNGFITLHRKLLDSGHFSNLPEAMFFAWLLLRAQWQDTEVKYKGRKLKLKRGQLALSYRDMASAWEWSEAKCRRIIKKFCDAVRDAPTDALSDALCDAHSDAGVNIITIRKYNDYQNIEKTVTQSATHSVTQPAKFPCKNSDAQNKQETNNINKRKKEAPRKSLHICPVDWIVNGELLKWCLEHSLSAAEVKIEEDKFVFYFTEGGGAGKRRAGWEKSFKAWVSKHENYTREIVDPNAQVNDMWIQRLKYFKEHNQWMQPWGTDPTDIGTQVPLELLIKHGYRNGKKK